jgi:hypothetical protein
MTTQEFIDKWEIEFSNTPVKIFRSSKLLEFTNDIAVLDTGGSIDVLNENTGAAPYATKTKRIGYTNDSNVFSGIEINTLNDGDPYTYLYIYDNGVLIATYGTDDGSNFIFAQTTTINNPLDFNDLLNTQIPTKGVLQTYSSGASKVGSDIVLPYSNAQVKKYYVSDAVIASVGTTKSFFYNYNSLTKESYIGERIEIYFKSNTNGTVTFNTFNYDYYTTPIAIVTNGIYKFVIDIMPYSSDVRPYASLQTIVEPLIT